MITRYYYSKSLRSFIAKNEKGVTYVDTGNIPSVKQNFLDSTNESHREVITQQDFLKAYNRTLERIHLATFGNEKPKEVTCNFKEFLNNIKSFFTKKLN